MKVGGDPIPRAPQPNTNNNSRPTATKTKTSSISLPSYQNSGYLSYLNPQTWQRSSGRESYPEDHLFVALKSPSHSRAGDIEISISLHAFRTKSNLESMNRSQRLFYHMICKMTGLQSLPSGPNSNHSDSNPEDTTNEQNLMMLNDEIDDGMMVARTCFGSETVDSKRTYSSSQNSQQDFLTGSESPPSTNLEKLSISPNPVSMIIETQPTPTSPFNPNQSVEPIIPRPLSDSSFSPRSSMSDHSPEFRQSLYLNKPSQGQPFEKLRLDRLELYRLHSNLKDRILSFFCQKSEGQKIRIQIYGFCGKTEFKNLTCFGSGNDESNLISLQTDRYDIINNGRPLLTQIVTTKPGGVWSDTLLLPWQTIETHLRVYHQRQQKSLGKDNSKNLNEKGLMRLKIEAELVKEEGEQNKVLRDSQVDNLVQQENSLKGFVRKLSVARSSTEMQLDVIPSMAAAVHVISDIDDTIKQTNVLGGMKHVLRNVFLSEFDQVIVPGMAEWYRSMQELGCLFHYISNSPLELWYCIQGFLSHGKFPCGSVSLKEYARGATSILSGMLESAGNRKRQELSGSCSNSLSLTMNDAQMCGRPIWCRFICVGDSGEQDLEMYVSLAQAYPGRILGIYIRDVTTPSVNSNSSINQPLINSTPNLTTSTRSSREFFSSARSSSPLRSSGSNFVSSKTKYTEIGMRESVGNLESLIQIEKSVLELENKSKARPIAPPKPQHLCGTRTRDVPSSLPQAVPQPISAWSRLPVESPVGQMDDNGSENYFQRNSYHSTRKSNDSWSISETMITESNKLSYATHQTVLSEDHKINSSIETFRSRVKRAETELEMIAPKEFERILNDERVNESRKRGSNSEDEDQREEICVTRLKVFRGADECIDESLETIRRFIQ
ncbi:expressed protein [Phakopsora pachyrhizi]|uniref:Expressed protein n=1 Tax=Phakopsora pachyrhizi TaxID=170000 RepID=A0AAV0BIP8_PHAPC|nr:expressed protein [Phakopsora pachyrhizi]